MKMSKEAQDLYWFTIQTVIEQESGKFDASDFFTKDKAVIKQFLYCLRNFCIDADKIAQSEVAE